MSSTVLSDAQKLLASLHVPILKCWQCAWVLVKAKKNVFFCIYGMSLDLCTAYVFFIIIQRTVKGFWKFSGHSYDGSQVCYVIHLAASKNIFTEKCQIIPIYYMAYMAYLAQNESCTSQLPPVWLDHVCLLCERWWNFNPPQFLKDFPHWAQM